MMLMIYFTKINFFTLVFIKIQFLHWNLFIEFFLLKTLLSKLIFTTNLDWVIFKTIFFGIRLTTYSTISNFLSWRYLRFYTMEECTRGIFFWVKLTFSYQTFVRRLLCVIFLICEYFCPLYARFSSLYLLQVCLC
jgi:hypothetical protein